MSAKKRASKKQGTRKTSRATKKTTGRAKTSRRKSDELKKLEEQLMKRREELLRELQGGIGSLQKDASSPTGDSADVAMDIMQEDLYSQLAELEAQELARIEHALQRIREGTYGICEECGQQIPAARLKALPFTTLCVQCQAQYEEEYGESSVYTGPGAWRRVAEMELLSEEEAETPVEEETGDALEEEDEGPAVEALAEDASEEEEEEA